jgi:hypothetical protein
VGDLGTELGKPFRQVRDFLGHQQQAEQRRDSVMFSAVRLALQRDARFPASVFGPVLLGALRRSASICRYEVIGSCFPNGVDLQFYNEPISITLVKVTSTVSKQGHYAFDPKILAENPPADIEVAKIGDLLNCDLATFLNKR